MASSSGSSATTITRDRHPGAAAPDLAADDDLSLGPAHPASLRGAGTTPGRLRSGSRWHRPRRSQDRCRRQPASRPPSSPSSSRSTTRWARSRSSTAGRSQRSRVSAGRSRSSTSTTARRTGRSPCSSGSTRQTPRVHAVRFKRNFGQHPAMHAGLSRARGRHRRDDGRRPPEPAGGHPEARRGGRRRLRRRERAARGAERLLGPHAPVAPDQRHAAPVHEGRHLRLRLRVQRLPARRRDADARLDRPAEVHEGAHPLRRRVGDRGRRRAMPPARAPRATRRCG